MDSAAPGKVNTQSGDATADRLGPRQVALLQESPSDHETYVKLVESFGQRFSKL